MNRRELLTRFGAVLGTASLGGCLSEYRDTVGDVGETTTETETTTDEGTTEPETTTEEETTDETSETTDATTAEETGQQVTVSDTSFEVLESGCGKPTSQASVDFADESSVGVTGTVSGANACYTAELADANYDSETDAAVVTVASKKAEDAEMCADCITEIDYEATVTFEGGLPATVEVVHQSLDETATVATAESE